MRKSAQRDPPSSIAPDRIRDRCSLRHGMRVTARKGARGAGADGGTMITSRVPARLAHLCAAGVKVRITRQRMVGRIRPTQWCEHSSRSNDRPPLTAALPLNAWTRTSGCLLRRMSGSCRPLLRQRRPSAMTGRGGREKSAGANGG